MGNTNLLESTCLTPTDLCNSTMNHQSKYEESIVLKRHKVRSSDDIKQAILKYIEINKIQLYPSRERKILETLVSVEQQHVADRILQLDKRNKLLETQKKQLQWLKSKLMTKVVKEEKQKTQLSQMIAKYDQRETQLAFKITQTKDKRKKLFEESQCLLLQDLDMIFEQIPKFDQNYEYINSILSLSGALQQLAKEKSQNFNKEPSSQNNVGNEFLQTGRGPLNKNEKTETHHTNFMQNLHNPQSAKQDKKVQEKLRQSVRIQDKKSLKKNSAINSLGAEVLRTNGLLIIVPIQCFSGIGALRDNKKTGLPSRASLLQIFMNKVKAVNLRRGCNLGIAFLVNEKYATTFSEEIHKTKGFEQFVSFQKMEINSNLSNHESDENYESPIPYHVISFKNIWPSFDTNQKIMIDSADDQISFSTHDGDLFTFVENSIELKTLIEKYRYVNITNINNLLSQLGDAHVLGFLEEKQDVDIAVKVLKAKSQQCLIRDYFGLDEHNFITLKEVPDGQLGQFHDQNVKKKSSKSSYTPNQSFLDINEYYVKSRIFTAESGPLKRLLMSRISRRLNTETQNSLIQFYLQRSIASVLYSKFTVFITVDEEYEFSQIKSTVSPLKSHINKNGSIGYSKYCKKLLGIKQSGEGKQEEEIVEIDAGILHKGSQEISRLIGSLKKVKEVGFPIILYSDLFNNTKSDS